MNGAEFLPSVTALLERVENTQIHTISESANVIKNGIENGGVLHAFSSGHSHMMVEELFYRAGGLVPVNPIFDPNTMLHHGALRSTNFERVSGYAEVLLSSVETRPGEPILIVSHSGINPVPVEMAIEAKKRKMKVIAITSNTISSQLDSRVPSGERLMDVADQVIDNCIEVSEMAIEYDEFGRRVGAFSTIVSAYIIQRLVIEVARKYIEENKKPPVFNSANLPGGDEWNLTLINQYKDRVKLL
jgi:uncharacterized phosphosugar-binding protein